MNRGFLLYHHPMSVCSQRPRFVLAEKGAEWESRLIDIGKGEQRAPGYLALNPRGVVPTLVHGKFVLSQSLVIAEYLDAILPGPRFIPTTSTAVARMREWLQPFDERLHLDFSTISYAVFIAKEIRSHCPTPQTRSAYFSSQPDRTRAEVLSDIVEYGTQSRFLKAAIDQWVAQLALIGANLLSSRFMIGDAVTLADVAYLPYIDRFEAMGFSRLWREWPVIDLWLAALRDTSGYRLGCASWFPPERMAEIGLQGAAAWRDIAGNAG